MPGRLGDGQGTWMCGGPWVGISQLRSFQPIMAIYAWKSNMWAHPELGSLSHYRGNDWPKVVERLEFGVDF